MKPTTYVFVYGTLMRGYGNNAVLGDSRFIGRAETVGHCRLYHAGFPVLRERSKAGPNAPVRGEVFVVTDPEVMRNLDSLEGEGRMYHRRGKYVRMETGKRILAFAYVGDARMFSAAHRPLYPLGTDGRYYWPSGRAALSYGAA